MRTISALEVRAKFGQVLDEAAAGQRFIVERAGQPVAAIVSVGDLEQLDPARERARRHAALREIELRRAPEAHAGSAGGGTVAEIRAEREERTQRIIDAASR